MSIASDLRAYANTARDQGTELVGKITTGLGGLTTAANHAVTDLRAQAENRLNLDAVRSAVEPYVAQARDYGANVSGRAEGLYGAVRNDKRVSGLVDRAETAARPVLGLVQERVVQPVLTRTRRGGAESVAPSAEPPVAAPRKAATTRPAAPRKAAAKKVDPAI